MCCQGCQRWFCLCSACDRGQRYCSEECSGRARHRSLRAAGAKYQRSANGRARHAERQRRYRARLRRVLLVRLRVQLGLTWKEVGARTRASAAGGRADVISTDPIVTTPQGFWDGVAGGELLRPLVDALLVCQRIRIDRDWGHS